MPDLSIRFRLFGVQSSRLRHVLLSMALSAAPMLLPQHRARGASEAAPRGRPMGGALCFRCMPCCLVCCAPVGRSCAWHVYCVCLICCASYVHLALASDAGGSAQHLLGDVFSLIRQRPRLRSGAKQTSHFGNHTSLSNNAQTRAHAFRTTGRIKPGGTRASIAASLKSRAQWSWLVALCSAMYAPYVARASPGTI